MYATYAQFLNMSLSEQSLVTHLDMIVDCDTMHHLRALQMNKYERKFLVAFARFVRRGDHYSHCDLVDALPSSLVGKIVWC